MTKHSTDWSDDCLAQLEREEAVLKTALTSVRLIGTALAANDLLALATALAAQAEVVSKVYEARRLGHALFTQLGAKHVPGQKASTAAAVYDRLAPGLRTNIRERVEKLRELAALVERQNRSNAFVVRQSLRLVRRLLGVLLGARDGGERYSRAGTPQPSGTGSILNARG